MNTKIIYNKNLQIFQNRKVQNEKSFVEICGSEIEIHGKHFAFTRISLVVMAFLPVRRAMIETIR